MRNRQRVAQHQGEQGLYRQQATRHSQRECFAQCPGRHLACRRSPINICRNEVCVQPKTEAREGKQSLLLPQSLGFFVANRVTSDLKSLPPTVRSLLLRPITMRCRGKPRCQRTRNAAEMMGNWLGLTRDRTLGWRS